MTNTTRLKQIAEHDSDPLVRAAALSLFNQLTTRQVRVVEQQ